MTILKVVYPHFWVMNPNEAKEKFYSQLGVLKATSCVHHKVGEFGQIVLTNSFQTKIY
jgi:hypothetical protein